MGNIVAAPAADSTLSSVRRNKQLKPSVRAGCCWHALVTALSHFGPAGPCPNTPAYELWHSFRVDKCQPCSWQGLTCRHLEPNGSAWESSFWSYDHPALSRQPLGSCSVAQTRSSTPYLRCPQLRTQAQERLISVAKSKPPTEWGCKFPLHEDPVDQFLLE